MEQMTVEVKSLIRDVRTGRKVQPGTKLTVPKNAFWLRRLGDNEIVQVVKVEKSFEKQSENKFEKHSKKNKKGANK